MNSQCIAMVRENLLDIPVWKLPAGFSFHYYKPGDMDIWLDIERQADTDNTFDRQRFESTFSSRLDLLEQRMIFIFDEKGRPIATSTAWYEDDKVGLVHWVAVVPAFQGQGLAKPLLARTLERFVELGYQSAMLRTQTFRIAAINLYLKFGFVPLISSLQDTDSWREVAAKFKNLGINTGAVNAVLS